MGDLHAIFDNVPDRAEELQLSELLSRMRDSVVVSLSKLRQLSVRLSKDMFKAKMPSQLDINESRSYLASQWGMGQLVQDLVILCASTTPPGTRLTGAQEAKSFLDQVVRQFTMDHGIEVPVQLSSAGQDVSESEPSDATIQRLDDQKKTLEANTSIPSNSQCSSCRHAEDVESVVQEQKSAVSSLRLELDGLTAELGTEFMTGIVPLWSKFKVRRYNSSHSWALQDLWSIFHNVSARKILDYSEVAIRKRCAMVVRRANPQLVAVMKDMVQHQTDSESAAVRSLLEEMIKNCCGTSSSLQLSVYLECDHYQPPNLLDNQRQAKGVKVNRATNDNAPRWAVATRASAPGMGIWECDKALSTEFTNLVRDSRSKGLEFQDKTILITGASPGSIGFEVMRGLLQGGAKVVVTTRSMASHVIQQYQGLYMDNGATGSELVVVNFNQGSQQDIRDLARYIYDPQEGLGWDLDHILPFAALSEECEIDSIDSRSELSHRIMLINVLRLLGNIKERKDIDDNGLGPAPTQVILPLSPNHGQFGNDGLYAESKLGLEGLLHKWHSESWASHFSICGAVIGWVRGTGLMGRSDVFAADVEKKTGIHTFNQAEMASCILAAMGEPLAIHNERQPLYVDLSGGMAGVPSLRRVLDEVRADLQSQRDCKRAVAEDLLVDHALEAKWSVHHQEIHGAFENQKTISPLSTVDLGFPTLTQHPKIHTKEHDVGEQLNDMLDLDRVVVITGFGEVGPYGSARTRWQVEETGTLSTAGYIELAWTMGLIRHHDGPLRDGYPYAGWVDSKSGLPINDCDVKARYGEFIDEHTGIRRIEPELDDGYTPDQKQFLQEIVVESDMPPFTVPKDVANQYKAQHGDKAVITSKSESECFVKLRKGATLLIPVSTHFDRDLAGQVPTGWDARAYGVPDWVISQVDRVTLFALISTVEAFLSSGIVDTFEIYKHLHVSEVGNCIGSGLGGTKSLKDMFRSRYLGKDIPNSTLQETFINSIAAWINMLVVSSSGPIRTPVGACATSIESLESGYEMIVSQKARMCIVGGADDMCEEVAYEFARMQATVNSDQEAASGREPSESSRPMTTSRAGFVESQGAGVQILTSAKLALEMGLPIRGIVAYVSTASDRIGRSLPAPGNGLLVNAKENVRSDGEAALSLDLASRKARFLEHQRQIREDFTSPPPGKTRESQSSSHGLCLTEGERVGRVIEFQEKQARFFYGNGFWHNQPHIAPIRGCLASWGLSIDDLDFASLHGTSTMLNDANETSVLQQQLSHLGRREGNTMFTICQKYLTGHSKGAAGAWMVNGCLQAMETGLVPGNRNADNISADVEKNSSLCFLHRSIQTSGLKACSVTSFGFGQKNAQAIIVHPRYLFASLKEADYMDYRRKVESRAKKANYEFQKGMAMGELFVAKETAPYPSGEYSKVMLDPHARLE